MKRRNRPAMLEDHMSEAEVKVVVYEAFETYEEKTGKPRHEENLANFATLKTSFDMLRGAVILVAFLVGVPGCVASILVIVSKLKGH